MQNQLTSPVINYYVPYKLLLVFENEGYIQANTTLKAKQRKRDDKLVFHIPNPSVYKIANTIVPADLVNHLCLENMWGLFNHNCGC